MLWNDYGEETSFKEYMANKEIEKELLEIKQLLLSQSLEPMTTEQAAQYLHVSTSYLYQLTSKRQIRAYKPCGKIMYFAKADLDAWAFSNPTKTIQEIEREALQYTEKRKAR